MTALRQAGTLGIGIALVLSVATIGVSPVGTVAAATNVLGGEQVDGALRITVEDGNVGVERYDSTSSSFVRQYYSYDSSDTALVIDGAIYDVPGGGTTDADGTELTVADQYVTNEGTTVVTEFEPAGETGIVLVQRISYVGTQQYFDLTWDVQNTGTTAVSDVRLLNGKDTYLAGGDYGLGFWNADANTVGVRKTVDGEQQRLAMRGITGPTNHQSNFYASIDSSLKAGSLTGTVDTTDHDNGYAMEWRTETLSAGDTWTVRARESFTKASIIASGPGRVQSTGGSTSLAFDVTNVGEAEADVAFDVTGPEGWTLSAPADRTLAGGETQTVTVDATPPEAAGTGLYDIVLTATSAGSIDTATGQVELVDASAESAASEAYNQHPEVEPLPEETVRSGETVRLTPAASDPDGEIVRYEWRSSRLTDVELPDATGPELSFVAPSVLGPESMLFELTVTDDQGAESQQTYAVTVLPPANVSDTSPESSPPSGAGSEASPACETVLANATSSAMTQQVFECRYPHFDWAAWDGLFDGGE